MTGITYDYADDRFVAWYQGKEIAKTYYRHTATQLLRAVAGVLWS